MLFFSYTCVIFFSEYIQKKCDSKLNKRNGKFVFKDLYFQGKRNYVIVTTFTQMLYIRPMSSRSIIDKKYRSLISIYMHVIKRSKNI